MSQMREKTGTGRYLGHSQLSSNVRAVAMPEIGHIHDLLGPVDGAESNLDQAHSSGGETSHSHHQENGPDHAAAGKSTHTRYGDGFKGTPFRKSVDDYLQASITVAWNPAIPAQQSPTTGIGGLQRVQLSPLVPISQLPPQSVSDEGYYSMRTSYQSIRSDRSDESSSQWLRRLRTLARLVPDHQQTRSLLREHSTSAVDATYTQPYGCTFDLCYRRFGSQGDWRQHELEHHFQHMHWRCDLSVPFSTSGTGCSELFSSEASFIAHLQSVHQMLDAREVTGNLKAQHRDANVQPQYWCGFCQTTRVAQKKDKDAIPERYDHVTEHITKEGKNFDDWVSQGRPMALKGPQQHHELMAVIHDEASDNSLDLPSSENLPKARKPNSHYQERVFLGTVRSLLQNVAVAYGDKSKPQISPCLGSHLKLATNIPCPQQTY